MIPIIGYKSLAIVYRLAQLGQVVSRRISALELYCWAGIFVRDEILNFLCMKGVGFSTDRLQPSLRFLPDSKGSSVSFGFNLVRALVLGLSSPYLFFVWRKCIGSWRNAVEAHRTIVVVALKQDVPLAKLLISDLPGNHVLVVLNDWMVLKSPSTLMWLRESDIDHIVLPRDVAMDDLLGIFDSESRKVLAIAESSLSDHSFSHRIQKAALSRGHDTATIQHGFENVGLTYRPAADSKTDSVKFASGRVFVWQPLNRLPEWVPPETRAKCTHVGPIKLPMEEREGMLPLPALRAFDKVVGVFENLHWERYSEEFRVNFFLLVSELAVNYPKVCFLVRPHPAGQWSSVHWTRGLPANVVIANSTASPWAGMEITDFLTLCSVALTTPSTVAVDAVLVGCPAVVYGGNLEVDIYGFAEIAIGYADAVKVLDLLFDRSAFTELVDLHRKRLVDYFGGKPSGVYAVRQWLKEPCTRAAD